VDTDERPFTFLKVIKRLNVQDILMRNRDPTSPIQGLLTEKAADLLHYTNSWKITVAEAGNLYDRELTRLFPNTDWKTCEFP
jgi:hypothetical protein